MWYLKIAQHSEIQFVYPYTKGSKLIFFTLLPDCKASLRARVNKEYKFQD